ncbi:MAG: alpha/beta hydrolase [Cyanobacteria bacterium J06632_22]
MGLFQVGLQGAIALSPHFTKSAQAAERITFSLGATIERSLSFDSLERYVESGEVTEELAPYLSYIDRLDPNAREQIRSLLSQRADLDVVTVAQFAYTPQGDYLLSQAGEVFRTGARLSGRKGLRGAAIVSAADAEEGLTILNVVRNFPTPVLRVDIRRGLAIANQAGEALRLSDAALDLVRQLALQQATEPFPGNQPPADLLDLATSSGPFQVRKLSVRVKASPQPVDVYLPQLPSVFVDGGNVRFDNLRLEGDLTNGWPAVVISHGLGNDRASYAYLAEYLASQGFAAISVEHSGSSTEQLDALVAGRVDEVVPNEEFVSRPMLITQVLDELSANPNFNHKNAGVINFQNVGVIGQSFGGYTAFAVAGAPVNLARLRNSCPPSFSVNLSLLLQCQAAELGMEDSDSLDFTDERIKAVIAINPMTSTIFGQEGLANVATPTLVIASSSDTVAPALVEQIEPFTWLTVDDRYLLMLEGASHFSTIGVTGVETFQLPPELLGPVPEVAQRYTQVMSNAFLQTYLRGDRRYQPILSSAFTTRFSQPEMPLSIISELDPERLARSLRRAAVDDAETQEILQALEKEMQSEETPSKEMQSKEMQSEEMPLEDLH